MTRSGRAVTSSGIRIAIPGRRAVWLQRLVLDFTGTLSVDGRLLPGVAQRLRRLAQSVQIVVATADTFGTVRQALAGVPAEIHLVSTGMDKARLVARLGASATAAIGNGRNDVAMLSRAALGIAVIGREGAARALLQEADAVTTDVRDALDLLLKPVRLTATLRR